MADKWAVATGNWSNTATWNGGTLPTSGDDVFADGFTVTIDQNVTVVSVRTTQRSGGTAGGGFVLGAGFTVNAAITGGTTTCITFSANSPNTATINGNVGATASAGAGINVTGTGTLFVVGNCTAGTGGPAINNNSGGTVNITGSCTGNGNVTAVNNNSTGFISVTGDCLGSTNTYGIGVGNNSTGSVQITGNCTGGSVGNGARNNNAGVMTIIGNCIGGAGVSPTSTAGYGALNASTGLLVITGNVIPNSTGGVTNSLAGGRIILNGNIQSEPNGRAGFGTGVFLIHASNTVQHEYRVNNAGAAGVARSLYTGGVNLNQPAIANVRSGIVYGASNEFTGTCAVPSAASVAVGVPIDDTVGTAAITAATIRAAVGLASANLDTQLSQLATDIDNITVDNAAIADAVRSELGLTGSLDSAFDTIPTVSEFNARTILAADYATAAQATAIETDTQDIQSRLPAALVSGRMDASVGAMASNTLTAAALATDAVTEIQVGLATSSGVTAAFTEIKGATWSSSTDTLEAIRDASGGGGTSIMVTPVVAQVPVRVRDTDIETYIGDLSTIRIGIFSGEDAVDLSGFGDLEVCVQAKDGTDLDFVPMADLTIDGADNNYVSWEPSGPSVATVRRGKWSLRKTSNKQVVAKGVWIISDAALEDAGS